MFGGNWFMKKTRSRKSRDNVPLMSSGPLILLSFELWNLQGLILTILSFLGYPLSSGSLNFLIWNYLISWPLLEHSRNWVHWFPILSYFPQKNKRLNRVLMNKLIHFYHFEQLLMLSGTRVTLLILIYFHQYDSVKSALTSIRAICDPEGDGAGRECCIWP